MLSCSIAKVTGSFSSVSMMLIYALPGFAISAPDALYSMSITCSSVSETSSSMISALIRFTYSPSAKWRVYSVPGTSSPNSETYSSYLSMLVAATSAAGSSAPVPSCHDARSDASPRIFARAARSPVSSSSGFSFPLSLTSKMPSSSTLRLMFCSASGSSVGSSPIVTSPFTPPYISESSSESSSGSSSREINQPSSTVSV